MKKVFLSYRRADTGAEAGRLADSLRQRCGRGRVFRDIVSISPGERFDEVLDTALNAARTVLVLIGPNWLTELDSRLQQANLDYHRQEVATALGTRKFVIPVLLRGAALPRAEALSNDLHGLSRCQAINLRDEAWDSDVDRLLEVIGRPFRWGRLALRAVIALSVIIVFAWKVLPQFLPDQASDYTFVRSVVVLLTCAYGLTEALVWLRDSNRL